MYYELSVIEYISTEQQLQDLMRVGREDCDKECFCRRYFLEQETTREESTIDVMKEKLVCSSA